MGWASQFRPLRSSWASWLFQNLGGEGVRRRDVFHAFNETAFVTFNYDRCLEQFLLANFIHSCNLAPDEAFTALNNIEIHHAYGSLGELPISGHHQSVKFGSEDPWAVATAAKRIKAFTEEMEAKSAEKINKIIYNADRMIFLGFGFHQRNLDLLFGINEPCPKIPCFGTRILSERAWRRAEKRFASALSQHWLAEYTSDFMRLQGEAALNL